MQNTALAICALCRGSGEMAVSKGCRWIPLVAVAMSLPAPAAAQFCAGSVEVDDLNRSGTINCLPSTTDMSTVS